MRLGEYWIDDFGTVADADGDTGDYNHMAVATNYAMDLLKSDLSAASNAVCHAAVYALNGIEGCDGPAVREAVLNCFDSLEKDGRITAEEAEDAWWYLQWHGQVDELLMRVCIHEDYCPRRWAMETQDWTAVRQHRVETHGLTDRKMKAIGRGLDEILEREGMYVADDDDFEEFILDDFATDKRYFVTVEDMMTGNMARLFQRTTRLGRDLSLQEFV